jgi:hypothetical protein
MADCGRGRTAMASEILDRLEENKLRGLEEFIASEGTVAVSSEDQAAAMADILVDEGIGVRQGLHRLWDYHWAMAVAGESLDSLGKRKNLRTLLERGSQALARSAAKARAYAVRSGRDVARLSQFEEQAAAFSLWVEECMARLEMLVRTPKPLDRERLARVQAAYARGEGEDAGDILARLKDGGPLVKE